MDDLVLADISFGETGADSERFAARSVRDVTRLTADVDVAFADSIEHWENRALTRHIDNRALVPLPHDMRGPFTAH